MCSDRSEPPTACQQACPCQGHGKALLSVPSNVHVWHGSSVPQSRARHPASGGDRSVVLHHLRSPWMRGDHSEIVNVDVAGNGSFLSERLAGCTMTQQRDPSRRSSGGQLLSQTLGDVEARREPHDLPCNAELRCLERGKAEVSLQPSGSA